jgi:hypothetical protein
MSSPNYTPSGENQLRTKYLFISDDDVIADILIGRANDVQEEDIWNMVTSNM